MADSTSMVVDHLSRAQAAWEKGFSILAELANLSFQTHGLNLRIDVHQEIDLDPTDIDAATDKLRKCYAEFVGNLRPIEHEFVDLGLLDKILPWKFGGDTVLMHVLSPLPERDSSLSFGYDDWLKSGNEDVCREFIVEPMLDNAIYWRNRFAAVIAQYTHDVYLPLSWYAKHLPIKNDGLRKVLRKAGIVPQSETLSGQAHRFSYQEVKRLAAERWPKRRLPDPPSTS